MYPTVGVSYLLSHGGVIYYPTVGLVFTAPHKKPLYIFVHNAVQILHRWKSAIAAALAIVGGESKSGLAGRHKKVRQNGAKGVVFCVNLVDTLGVQHRTVFHRGKK